MDKISRSRLEEPLTWLQEDLRLFASTALEMGLTMGINSLTSTSADQDLLHRRVIRCAYLCLLASKIWKQSVVSNMLPLSCNRLIRHFTSPIGAGIAIGLSHLTGSRAFEIPISVVTTYFLAERAIRNKSKEGGGVSLVNACGSAMASLDTMGFISLINQESWEQAFTTTDPRTSNNNGQEDQERLRQELFRKKMERLEARIAEEKRLIEERANLLKEKGQIDSKKMDAQQQEIDGILEDWEKRLADLDAKLAATDAKLDALDKEWEDLLDFLGNGGKDCISIQDLIRPLGLFDRAAHPNFNPNCIQHAKLLFSSEESPFDEGLFRKEGCEYIRSILRRISLITAVDKNPHRQELATRASINVNASAKVLCNLANPKKGPL